LFIGEGLGSLKGFEGFEGLKSLEGLKSWIA